MDKTGDRDVDKALTGKLHSSSYFRGYSPLLYALPVAIERPNILHDEIAYQTPSWRAIAHGQRKTGKKDSEPSDCAEEVFEGNDVEGGDGQ